MTRKWTPEELDAERPTPEEALAVADSLTPELTSVLQHYGAANSIRQSNQ